jgi:fibronectin-binding autotransporter adhesin
MKTKTTYLCGFSGNRQSLRAGRLATGIASVLALLCLGQSLRAQIITNKWNGASTSGGYWSDAANWTGVTMASGNAATFAGTTRQNNTNDLSGLILAGTISMSTANWNISGNPVTVSNSTGYFPLVANVAGTSTWGLDTTLKNTFDINQSATGDILNFTGVLSGVSGLMKHAGSGGQGVVYLSNTNNSFTGILYAYSGTIIYYSLALKGQNCSLGAGSTIYLGVTSTAYAPTFTYAGTTDGTTDRTLAFANNTTGTIYLNNNSPNNSSLTFTGPATFADGTANVFTTALGGTSSGTNTFTGQFGGGAGFGGGLSISGPGTWVFDNIIYLTGNLTVATNSHVVIGYNGSDPLNSTVFSAITLNSGGTFDVSAYDQNASTFVLGAYNGYPQTLTAGRKNGQAADINGSLSLAGTGGATLNVAGSGTPGTLTITSNFIPASASLLFDLSTNATVAGLGTNDLIVVGGNLDLSQGTAVVAINPLSGFMVQTNTPYTLIAYTGSLIGDASGLTVPAPSALVSAGLVSTATPGVVQVTFYSSGVLPANLLWQGNISQNWDVNTTSNWLNGATNDYFVNGSSVTFNDSASQFSVTLAGHLAPSTVTVSNNVNNYTFSSSGNGLLFGNCSLTKQGAAGLTMNGTNNTYSGGTVISAGTVLWGVNNALGTGPGVLGDSNSGSSPVNLLLNSYGMTVANAIMVTANGTGPATIGGASYDTINGPIAIQRDTTILCTNVLATSAYYSLYILGGLTGTGNVTVTGGGSVKWQTGPCSFAGNLNITQGNNPSPITNTTYLGLNATVSNMCNINVGTNTVLGFIAQPPFNALNGSGLVGPGYNLSGSPSVNIGNADGSGTFSGSFTTNALGYSCGIVKNGSGTQILTGDNSRSSGSTTINAGVLAVNNTTGSGLGSGSVTVGPSGTLAGSGLIYSRTNSLAVSGVLSVGNAGDTTGAALTLTNTGGLLISSGALNVDLFSGAGNGDNTGNSAAADVLQAQCPVTLSNATLSVGNPNGLTAWAIGDQWKIANWNSTPMNTFAMLNLPTLPTTMLWDVTNLYTAGVIAIVTNSLPSQPASITGVTLSDGNIIVTGTNLNGGQNFHYEIISSTNLTLPLTNWTVLATNAFNADGTFSFTNAISPATPAMFFDTKAVH